MSGPEHEFAEGSSDMAVGMAARKELIKRTHRQQEKGRNTRTADWKRKNDKLTSAVRSLEAECSQRRERLRTSEDECHQKLERLRTSEDECRQKREKLRTSEDECCWMREKLRALENECHRRRERLVKALEDECCRRLESLTALEVENIRLREELAQSRRRSRTKGQSEIHCLNTESQDSTSFWTAIDGSQESENNKQVTQATRELSSKNMQRTDQHKLVKEPFNTMDTRVTDAGQINIGHMLTAEQKRSRSGASAKEISDKNHQSLRHASPQGDEVGKLVKNENVQVGDIVPQDDGSPKHSKAAGLRLTRGSKRARYMEGPVSENKKLRIPQTHVMPVSKSQNSRDEKDKLYKIKKQISASSVSAKLAGEDRQHAPDSVPHVLVADTCDLSLPIFQAPRIKGDLGDCTSGTNPKLAEVAKDLIHQGVSRSQRMKDLRSRPDMVIPETMPMDYEDNPEEDYQEDESQSQPLTAQRTVRCLQISPPSHSSTPLNYNLRQIPGSLTTLQDLQGSFLDPVLEDKNNKNDLQEIPAGKSNRAFSRHANDAQSKTSGTGGRAKDEEPVSDPESPVFSRNPSFLHRENGSQCLGSPSLFDSDKEDEDPQIPWNPEVKRQEHIEKRRKMVTSASAKEINVSTQSNPSPSVISGRTVQNLQKAEPATEDHGWLSSRTEKGKLRSSQGSAKASQGSSDLKPYGSSRSEIDDDMVTGRKTEQTISVKTFNKPEKLGQLGEQSDLKAVSSPDSSRLTRSKQKKLSQEASANESPGSGRKPALIQTKISENFFQPKMIYLPKTAEFNGGSLRSSQRELSDAAKEMRDLEMVMQKSLEDFNAIQDQIGLGVSFVPDMTGPQLTSTPCCVSIKKKTTSNSEEPAENGVFPTVFKKPTTPRKAYDTPKKRSPKDLELELRRSPRLKKVYEESQDDTIDPNEMKEISPNSPRRQTKSDGTRKPKSNRCLYLDQDSSTHSMSDERLRPNTEMVNINGSLDPDLRLSDFDPEHPSIGMEPFVSEPPCLEPISFLEICEAESLQAIQMKSQKSGRPDPSQSLPGEHPRHVDMYSEDIELSRTSVVFGPGRIRTSKFDPSSPSDQGGRDRDDDVDCRAQGAIPGDLKPADTPALDDSFDMLPQKELPKYAYVDVVRKRQERQQLQTYACAECERYYGQADLTQQEIGERMKNCRHRARFVPPGTPEHFWSVGFPDTQECEERGYLNKTQHKPSYSKRQKGYRKLFLTEKEEREQEK